LDDEGKLAIDDNGGPVVAAPMIEWRLQTEPWIFVVDADGRIAARFEGAASPSELQEAIQKTLS
jgi:glutathione peroxidase-family protein